MQMFQITSLYGASGLPSANLSNNMPMFVLPAFYVEPSLLYETVKKAI
jgi:hypothetical protein